MVMEAGHPEGTGAPWRVLPTAVPAPCPNAPAAAAAGIDLGRRPGSTPGVRLRLGSGRPISSYGADLNALGRADASS